MFVGIADYVGHRRLFPTIVNFCVAFFAGTRANIMCGGHGRLLSLLLPCEWAQAANKNDQPPDVACIRIRIPSGHPRKLDAIFYDVADLTIAKALGFLGAK